MGIQKIEIQDDQKNIYYPHTDSSVVKYKDSTAEETLDNFNTQLNAKANKNDLTALTNPELLKKYRQKILDKYQDQPLFYTLKTNVSGTVSEFKDSPSIDIETISYTKPAPAKKQYYSQLLESDSENKAV